MSTLLVILAHSGAQDAIDRHFPFWERTCWDILGVGRENTTTAWPSGAFTFNCGLESYVNGDNHLRRFLDVLTHCLNYSHSAFCLIEYDCLTFPPMALHPGGFTSVLAGYRSPGFTAANYYHCPWWMDRPTAQLIIQHGTRLLNERVIEHGFIDRWLGLLCERNDIPITPLNAYTRNTLDYPRYITEAREAVRNGAQFIHGCKTKEQFEQLTQP